MARPRSEQTLLIKEKMIARLKSGFHPPGQRFFSNRGLAAHFGVSYQTADRLIRELVDEGWLERRPSAGTYVSGKSQAWQGAALVFHERARRPGSFGARLLDGLTRSLAQSGIATRVVFHRDENVDVPADWLPVLWECRKTLAHLAQQRRFLLLLNDTPPPGLASGFVDAVACDDFSGGAAAAEWLRGAVGNGTWAVIAGPHDDERSRQRVAGFLSISPEARVFWAPSWEADAASAFSEPVAHHKPDGIFCCSDRLAEGLLRSGTTAAVVGFDDAPVAETLDLTTIAIPWEEMTAGAVDIIRRRLQGESGTAARRIYAPRPVVRRTFPTPREGAAG